MPEAPYHPTLDVYRDKDGNPVTVTPEQCAAVMHALRVWHQIRVESGYYDNKPHLELTIDKKSTISGFPTAEITKSRLLGRLLYEGRPPMAEAPPVGMSEPLYHLTDPMLCPECGRERTDLPGCMFISIIKPGHREIRYCTQLWHAVRPIWEQVYDILEFDCGAPPSGREAFLAYMDGPSSAHDGEYRFQGSLGFGGKFWWVGEDPMEMRVTCYQEDETPERLVMMAVARAHLAFVRV